ncbi:MULTISPECIES: hypothetical protein [unclassified Corallococcus]|uniref:hypothetical protein n=1 Tax=unclassified Corallococcus TaxID=2685029 RepID=UPI001A8F8F65|nr:MULTISPECIES: hypothetical protein [unclassified Corallococcus]MBN9685395.1 hypothetical protein [Corallococcus sp. NCSPR001]WAS83154.1 hypothetical protein O0N60_28015 [Corallococcus sp. NCRR]
MRADLLKAEKWMEGILNSDGLLSYVPDWLGGDEIKDFVVTEGQRSQISAVKMARENYTRWSTVLRSWVERGTRDDGKDYTVKTWLELGNANASQLASALGAFWDSSIILNGAAGTAEQTVESAKEVAEDVKKAVSNAVESVTSPWSTKTKVLAGFVGVSVGLGLIGFGLNSIPGFGLVKKAVG